MNLRNLVAACSLVSSIYDASGVFAQTAPPTRAPAQIRAAQPTTQNGQQQAWHGNDQMFASCVSIDNQAEITLAQFGQSRTQNADVRQFADMLIEQHQQFQQKLQKFAPNGFRPEVAERGKTADPATPAPAGTVTQAGVTNNGVAPIQQTAGTQPAARQEVAIDPVKLHQEIASQCLADCKQMLSEKDADKFDACFVGQQIAMHGAMISKLTVLKRHSSGELSQVLDEGLQSTRKHLQKAEKLMEQLAEAEHDKESNRQK